VSSSLHLSPFIDVAVDSTITPDTSLLFFFCRSSTVATSLSLLRCSASLLSCSFALSALRLSSSSLSALREDAWAGAPEPTYIIVTIYFDSSFYLI
jgi:hypothetical protein